MLKTTEILSSETHFGELDDDKLRTGFSTTLWDSKARKQKFEGYYHKDNLHGFGQYNWKAKNIIYRGNFFCNNIEGYGYFDFKDDSVFEGLMRNNQRFGPGVFTYPNGSEDVGLWYHESLIRLSEKVLSETVPRLAKTWGGVISLLRFRNLVKVKIYTPEVIEQILKQYDIELSPDEINKLYSPNCRNTECLCFNLNSYIESYTKVGSEMSTRSIELGTISSSLDLTNDVNILAWNNTQTLMDLLEFCFYHRNDEIKVNFDVQSLLIGNRDGFGTPGCHETACKDFLVACADGESSSILRFTNKYKINPDVSDSRGNTGIMYAASTDRLQAIVTLRNLGANMNYLNDENITPLGMALTRYISELYDVEDWETCFIPKELLGENEDYVKWRFRKSYLESDFAQEELDKRPAEPFVEFQKEKTTVKQIKRPGSKDNSGSDIFEKNEKIEDYLFDTKISEDNQAHLLFKNIVQSLDKTKIKILDIIEQTILTLLENDANPSFGEVPLPNVFLAIFSQNLKILEECLKNKADVNKTSSMLQDMSPLHFLLSLPPTETTYEMLKILLNYGADPNAVIDATIFFDNLYKFIDEDFHENEYFITPINLLASKSALSSHEQDIVIRMFKILVEYGADTSQKFLGHSTLIVALLARNMDLVRKILNEHLVKINEKDYLKALLLLFLKQFKKYIPVDIGKEMIELLHDYRMNFLQKIEGDKNIIDLIVSDKFKYDQRPELKKILLEKIRGDIVSYVDQRILKKILRLIKKGSYNEKEFNTMVNLVGLKAVLEALEEIMIGARSSSMTAENLRSCLPYLKQLYSIQLESEEDETADGETMLEKAKRIYLAVVNRLKEENENIPDEQLNDEVFIRKKEACSSRLAKKPTKSTSVVFIEDILKAEAEAGAEEGSVMNIMAKPEKLNKEKKSFHTHGKEFTDIYKEKTSLKSEEAKTLKENGVKSMKADTSAPKLLKNSQDRDIKRRSFDEDRKNILNDYEEELLQKHFEKENIVGVKRKKMEPIKNVHGYEKNSFHNVYDKDKRDDFVRQQKPSKFLKPYHKKLLDDSNRYIKSPISNVTAENAKSYFKKGDHSNDAASKFLEGGIMKNAYEDKFQTTGRYKEKRQDDDFLGQRYKQIKAVDSRVQDLRIAMQKDSKYDKKSYESKYEKEMKQRVKADTIKKQEINTYTERSKGTRHEKMIPNKIDKQFKTESEDSRFALQKDSKYSGKTSETVQTSEKEKQTKPDYLKSQNQQSNREKYAKDSDKDYRGKVFDEKEAIKSGDRAVLKESERRVSKEMNKDINKADTKRQRSRLFEEKLFEDKGQSYEKVILKETDESKKSLSSKPKDLYVLKQDFSKSKGTIQGKKTLYETKKILDDSRRKAPKPDKTFEDYGKSFEKTAHIETDLKNKPGEKALRRSNIEKMAHIETDLKNKPGEKALRRSNIEKHEMNEPAHFEKALSENLQEKHESITKLKLYKRRREKLLKEAIGSRKMVTRMTGLKIRDSKHKRSKELKLGKVEDIHKASKKPKLVHESKQGELQKQTDAVQIVTGKLPASKTPAGYHTDKTTKTHEKEDKNVARMKDISPSSSKPPPTVKEKSQSLIKASKESKVLSFEDVQPTGSLSHKNLGSRYRSKSLQSASAREIEQKRSARSQSLPFEDFNTFKGKRRKETTKRKPLSFKDDGIIQTKPKKANRSRSLSVIEKDLLAAKRKKVANRSRSFSVVENLLLPKRRLPPRSKSTVTSDENKKLFKACFECGKSKGQILILCPVCREIYFCSEHCNRLSLKRHMHKCNNLFYNTELRKLKQMYSADTKKQKKTPDDDFWKALDKIQHARHGHDIYLRKLDSSTIQIGTRHDHLPREIQRFLQKLAELYPDLKLQYLIMPYCVFMDGQLYYRFHFDPAGVYFINTYSSI